MSPENRTYPVDKREGFDERSLFPGLVAIGLTLTALVRSRGPTVLVYAALALFAFDLSLGLNGFSYRVLKTVIPPLDSLRAPARFASIVLLALSVLAAIGLQELTAKLTARRRAFVAAILATVCLVEYRSAPIHVRAATTEPSAVYRWLNAVKPRLIVELLLPAPNALWYYESTHEYMSIFHWTPLVNGYSGHNPTPYVDFLSVMQTFPSPESVAALKALGVEHVIVHERFYSPPELAVLLERLMELPAFSGPLPMPDEKDPAWVFPLASGRQRPKS